ncbi:hypothetical protein H2198_001144 [Neophaeococcomyces mojaviensis]|uniref:Uncharacterized protein n=1 Tax=Neophaeococcomyces mojaviensis TaxID=3383035 RepID=A0ACC3AI78_9EURO|nr:hypothetical protein H2198_001144 [Knufia sp. JES_112]
MAEYDSRDCRESVSRIRGLRLHIDGQADSQESTNTAQKYSQRPVYQGSAPSQDTIRACATPPIEIPGQSHNSNDHDYVAVESASSVHNTDSYIDHFLKNRKSSIAFDNEVRTSTGQRHNILDPARKPVKNGQPIPRGRSLAQALSEHRSTRPHSESDRSHYDPFTGRHLPEYSSSPPKDEAQVGEARFPLLQATVDALARQHSRTEPEHPLSMTSDSTVSPVDEAIVTPRDDDNQYMTSPINISSSLHRAFSSSYDPPRPRSQRKASERWRDGEAAQDFFTRAGSLKKGSIRDSNRRFSRRDTFGSSTKSAKSTQSAASSFLHGFSMSSGGDDSAPSAADAEGATIGEDYVLGKQIGYGGFSIIREVTQLSSQTGTQRTLAVKIVKKQIDGKTKAQNDQAQAEFEHEVDLWRLLNHKHILALEAVYELKEATFCFVPLNTGGTLFDVVSSNRQGLSPDLAANYAYQLASALRYLHLDARVVHRDVKLENCLIDTTRGEPGLLRLCDFGLAEWISNDNSDTNSNPDAASSPPSINNSNTTTDRAPMRYFGPSDTSTSAFAGGSLEYAAPEILKIATHPSGMASSLPPQQCLVSPAVDIWAMGVCIYALLMGRRPFQDSFQPRIVMAVLAGDWDKVALKEKTSRQAYKLVKSCLKMDALERPNISQVIEDEWFDEARAKEDGTDGESDSGRNGAWRL